MYKDINDLFINDFVDEKQLKKKDSTKEPTYKIHKERKKEYVINHTEVLNKNNEFNRKVGNYISIQFEELNRELIETAVIKKIKYLLNRAHFKKNMKVLIVGLGNTSFLSDSLGPLVIKRIKATSHLMETKKDLQSISTIIPGVMAMTGLESSSIVASIIKEEKIDLVIVIDSLATRDIKRLYNTFQLSDTGINPGSGVENHRKEISKETLKIPVICIGVATVVEASSIVYEAIKKIGISNDDNVYDYIKDSLTSNNVNYFLTAKDIDNRIEFIASIIASSLNQVFNPGLI